MTLSSARSSRVSRQPTPGRTRWRGLIRLERRLRQFALRSAALAAQHTYDPHELPDERLLWSKGVARLCDFSGPPDYWMDETEAVQSEEVIAGAFAGAAGLVWVRLGTRSRNGEAVDLDAFVAHVLPTIDRPFVLLTTDGDASVPYDLRSETVVRLLASPWLRAWYTQNCELVDNPRIRPFPIGLSLHSRRPFGSPLKSANELGALAMAARPAAERPLSVYSDIAVSRASNDRIFAAALLNDVPHVRMQWLRVSQTTTWRRYAGSRFVLSLMGNGLDAFRTWEALYLGAIVITLRSSLDPLYEGLPVVVIDRLEEIADPENLVRWSQSHLPFADRDEVWRRLDARLWTDRLRQHLERTPWPAQSAADDAGPAC